MAEVIKLKISPAVAAYVRPGTPAETRHAGCRAAQDMPPSDCVMLLFCLSKDSDLQIRQDALAVLGGLPDAVLVDFLAAGEGHPAVLNLLAQVCHNRSRIRDQLLATAQLPQQVRELLVRHQDAAVATPAEALAEAVPSHDADAPEQAAAGDDAEGDGEAGCEEDEGSEEVEQDGEEFLSKYKMAQVMGIAEKIKMALSGDKEWRSILIKDANKLVSGSVIKNPRITEAEILALLKSGVQNDEIMRLICANKEWVKNYKIRKALVENNRTPLPAALRFLSTLGEKDIAQYAKSKNISSVIATQAKRLLLNKKK